MTDPVNHRNVMDSMGTVFTSVAEILDRPDWDGLRASHLRLLCSVPAQGIRLTDLAQSLRMTKQGAGQLATTLVQKNLLAQGPDPTDGRARIVTITTDGTRTVSRLEQELREIESRWSEEVGSDDYATFRRVLSHLGRPRTAFH